MRRPARPRSAGSQKRGPSADARARDVRDPSALAREEFVVNQQKVRIAEQRLVENAAPHAGLARGPVRPAAKTRPRSAQARREGTAGVDKEHCLELKRTANSLNEENMKTRTRLRVLERETQRRDKLLRELALVKKTGQCIDMAIIEKLKEERNMLPIVRKKAQDAQLQVEEKEAEIRELKRDPQFTRIIELQVEYATWQHEAKRIDSLLQNPVPEVNNAAKQEIDVHSGRVEKLEAELADAGERRTKAAVDLAESEADHARELAEYQEKEKELVRQQELTREFAIAFKTVLQKRKQVEQLQGEIEEMNVDLQKCEEELQDAADQAAQDLPPPQLPLGRASVTQAASSGASPGNRSPANSLLNSVRRAAALRSGDASLFAELLRRDTDGDGILSSGELAEALATLGISQCDYSPQEFEALLHLAPAAPGAQPGQLRWLDFLVLLDRSSAAHAPPPLPPLAPLRAACLRAEVFAEDFRSRLSAAATRSQAEAFFASLGLDAPAVAAWVAAWEVYGADGLLLRIPVGDVAFCQADFDAWLARCVDAVRTHRDASKFKDALQTWREDMQLTQEQFNMICDDILSLELSHDDIVDLGLFVSGGGEGLIDGEAVLRLEERRRPGPR